MPNELAPRPTPPVAPGEQQQAAPRLVAVSQELLDYAANPRQSDEAQKDEVMKEAKRASSLDGARNRVVAHVGEDVYWGTEQPTVFTFDGTLRGNFDHFGVDPDQQSAEAVAGPGGDVTHVLIETDDGHAFMVARTSPDETKGAADQEFKMKSTTLHMGKDDGETLARTISSEQLRDVVLVPGQPMTLSPDSKGKRLSTRGNITRITTVQRREDSRVPENHPYLQKPEMQRNPGETFNAAIEQARRMDVSSVLGPLAVKTEI